MMDVNKLIYSHCFNPSKVWITNPVTRERELRDVPCGKCYHCRITKVNEWVTRMTLETKSRKYCYFVTLTYSKRCIHTDVFGETQPQWSNINTEHEYQYCPLLLRKDHVQKFIKRLRKNTGIKFKYFAVGEYGHTYGRPHYHLIIWSDVPISKIALYRAWSTIDFYGSRVIIGNIDYNVISRDGIIDKSQDKSFKYVCKYLQKGDYDYTKLPTYRIFENYKKTLYELRDIKSDKCPFSSKDLEYRDTFYATFSKRVAPFMLCSKSPAIGFDYLQENIDRFKTGDFRLFGLPKEESYILPTYYVRKTKERLCPYCCVNEETKNLRSNAGVPDLVSVLSSLQNSIEFMESFLHVQSLVHYDSISDKITFENSANFGPRQLTLRSKYFTFFDKLNRRWFELDGIEYRMYRHTRKGIVELGHISVADVLERLKNTYKCLYDNILRPQYYQRLQRERDQQEYINSIYGDSWCDVLDVYRSNFMSKIDEHQRKYKLTKNKF